MSKRKKVTPEAGQASPQARNYQIVGLDMKTHMPVLFKGVMIDLANMTNQQASELIKAGYPHVIPE